MTTIGAIFLPHLPPERLRGIACAAESAGVEELWLWEDCFFEGGVAAATAALAWTERLRVGIGVLPVPLRNVAITAMETATVARMFPGRFHVGIGHGVQDWMGQVGARVASPMTLLREYTVALRALLAGETVSTVGGYVTLDRVALEWPPIEPPAVMAAAVGPKTLRLSGEVADGTVLTAGTTVQRVREARELVDAGRAHAGRAPGQRIVVYVHAATGPTAAARLEAERAQWGYDSIEEVAVSGDAEQMAAGIRRFAEAGADAVILQPTPDDPDPEGFMRFVGEKIRPLVG